MKRFILVLLFTLISLPVFAQQTVSPESAETVVVKKSDLTAEQLAKVNANEVKEQLGEYSEYAQMGKGIGLAFGEALKAVKDVTVELSDTQVGKYAMFLIAWKVMAKDVIGMGDMVLGYIVGPSLLFLGAVVLVWSYRRQCLPRIILKKKTREGLKVTKEYETLPPNAGSDTDDWAMVHLVSALVLIIVCSMIMFG